MEPTMNEPCPFGKENSPRARHHRLISKQPAAIEIHTSSIRLFLLVTALDVIHQVMVRIFPDRTITRVQTALSSVRSLPDRALEYQSSVLILFDEVPGSFPALRSISTILVNKFNYNIQLSKKALQLSWKS
jgi:hypothetical protein